MSVTSFKSAKLRLAPNFSSIHFFRPIGSRHTVTIAAPLLILVRVQQRLNRPDVARAGGLSGRL